MPTTADMTCLLCGATLSSHEVTFSAEHVVGVVIQADAPYLAHTLRFSCPPQQPQAGLGESVTDAPDDGPAWFDTVGLRIRLNADMRRWLVATMYDMIWASDLMAPYAGSGTVEELLEVGPAGARLALRRRYDAVMAHELLDRIDWNQGKAYAEALLVYEVQGSVYC